MKLNPTPDVIVLKRIEKPTESPGGIVLPERSAIAPNSDKIAEVVCVGDNIDDDYVTVGDKVAWSPFNVTAVNFGSTTGTLFFVKVENILAIIKETE